MISNLFPPFTVDDVARHCVGNSIVASQRGFCDSPQSKPLANLSYGFCCEFVACNRNARGGNPSSLLHGIVKVVSGCSKKKVVWVATSGVVTGMKHSLAEWNFPTCENPRKPVSQPNICEHSEGAVTRAVFGPIPLPTHIAIFNNLCPKSLRACFSTILPVLKRSINRMHCPQYNKPPLVMTTTI